MNPFTPTPPDWIAQASHARGFECSRCGAAPGHAQAVWINRRAPVYTANHQRKWQEFYHCQCGFVWWAWSSDRPPSELAQHHRPHPLDPSAPEE
ncbi:hypothetical protein RIF25_14745 [Thermosynechococcaceae cyanobacterium BACA0444]|uniref:Uncharacterized protein n=1 Tax=Pseudocalidococcus azoricus BACA0444 TaxID=2918990 RepID=A0AAE4FUE1_9CYAN|nr:hypothetical protein [Pseudocalidococcus azoricus]MDS3862058.1 hypothetical protein [Pseudocalidococcus azoricus BACA0444]